MKPFISCNKPVRINTSKGIRYVSCGKCVQCMNAKRSRTSLLLDLEGQYSKYVEFITLTYADEYLPYMDFQAMFDNMRVLGNNFSEIPIHLGNRCVSNFGKLEVDESALNLTVPFHIQKKYYGYQDFLKQLSQYNKRVDEYYKRFPNRKRGVRQRNVVPILWYSDLQKYIKRLRAYVKKTFDIQFRYFAIGEYGTNGLRPHWHILLFHNSSEFHSIFDEVVILSGDSSSNVRECAAELYRASLWVYGDCVTSTTDKRLSSYLASYVNQPADFPAILAPYRQKTFHSVFLGEHRDNKYLSSLFRNEDWEQLCTVAIKDSKGIEKNVSVPSSSYDRFNIRLTSVSLQNVQKSYELLYTTKQLISRYLQDTGEILNIYEESSLYSFYKWLLSNGSYSVVFDTYLHDTVRLAYVEQNTLNPLYSLCYGVHKLYKMSDLLGVSCYRYLQLLSRFRSWLDLRNLNEWYSMLECDDNYAYQHYASLDPITGVYDLKRLYTMPLFMAQQSDANIIYTSDIKHREVSETYKF